MRARSLLVVLTGLALSLAPLGASAQTRNTPRPEPAPAPSAPQQPDGPPPPDEPQLLRLSENMGSQAYLRDLCGLKDGDAWRNRMRALLDAEAQTETRRERLAGAYNRGFKGYEVLYRSCTPNAELIIQRFLDEGGKIARDVSNRFGGG